MQTLVTPEQRQAAKREIIWQVEQGASAKVARSHSPVLMHRTMVYRLLKRVQSEGERALTDGRHGHPVKLRGEVLAFVVEHCQINPCVSSPTVQRALQERFTLAVSVSQLNRVRASLGLSRKPVPREKKPKSVSVEPGDSEGAGGLLRLPAASETGLLTQLENALPRDAISPYSPLTGSSAGCVAKNLGGMLWT
jgi:transposase